MEPSDKIRTYDSATERRINAAAIRLANNTHIPVTTATEIIRIFLAVGDIDETDETDETEAACNEISRSDYERDQT